MYFLKKTSEFNKVFNTVEKKIYGKFFILIISKNKEEELKIGLSIGKKVGNAVTRNRVKRRIKAYFRDFYSFKVNKSVVLIGKPQAGESSWKQIKNDLNYVFARV